MPINNRGLAGQPTLPYIDFRSYAGADVFIDLTYLDHTGTPAIPTKVVYQLDDLTNAQNMIPPTTATTPVSSTQTIQIAGSLLQMSRQWEGSQICQLYVVATLPDTSNVIAVQVLELCSIQTPGALGF